MLDSCLCHFLIHSSLSSQFGLKTSHYSNLIVSLGVSYNKIGFFASEKKVKQKFANLDLESTFCTRNDTFKMRIYYLSGPIFTPSLSPG